MKKLIVALMVLTTLVSCGKDNKVASKAVAAASPATTAITVADQAGIALGGMIDNYTTQFGLAQVNYYGNWMTYGQLANSATPFKFLYTKSTTATSANGQTCEKKWGIFYVCSYSSSSSTTSSLPVSRTVVSNGVNIAAKQAELKDIINRKNPLIAIQVSGTSYYIRTTDGKDFVIDTRYPLQANPTGIKDTTGTEFLFNITE